MRRISPSNRVLGWRRRPSGQPKGPGSVFPSEAPPGGLCGHRSLPIGLRVWVRVPGREAPRFRSPSECGGPGVRGATWSPRHHPACPPCSVTRRLPRSVPTGSGPRGGARGGGPPAARGGARALRPRRPLVPAPNSTGSRGARRRHLGRGQARGRRLWALPGSGEPGKGATQDARQGSRKVGADDFGPGLVLETERIPGLIARRGENALRGRQGLSHRWSWSWNCRPRAPGGAHPRGGGGGAPVPQPWAQHPGAGGRRPHPVLAGGHGAVKRPPGEVRGVLRTAVFLTGPLCPGLLR